MSPFFFTWKKVLSYFGQWIITDNGQGKSIFRVLSVTGSLDMSVKVWVASEFITGKGAGHVMGRLEEDRKCMDCEDHRATRYYFDKKAKKQYYLCDNCYETFKLLDPDLT